MIIIITARTIHLDIWKTGLGSLIRLGQSRINVQRILNRYRLNNDDEKEEVRHILEVCLNTLCLGGFQAQCCLTELPSQTFYSILDAVLRYLLIKVKAQDLVKIVANRNIIQ